MQWLHRGVMCLCDWLPGPNGPGLLLGKLKLAVPQSDRGVKCHQPCELSGIAPEHVVAAQ